MSLQGLKLQQSVQTEFSLQFFLFSPMLAFRPIACLHLRFRES